MTGRKSAAALLASLATLGWLTLAMTAVAASPSPGAGAGGDPRSSGQGPGLVGDPIFAVLAVVAVGLAAVLLTLAYIRLTGRRRA